MRPCRAAAAVARGPRIASGLFWIHIGSFALYNALIGYLLLHREVTGLAPLLTYFVAMALHFIVNDYSLQEIHRKEYRRGRWVLAAAVLAGWAIGALTTVREDALALLFAFLAGGIALNALKEELPEERKSSLLPFAVGVVFYAALLVAAA